MESTHVDSTTSNFNFNSSYQLFPVYADFNLIKQMIYGIISRASLQSNSQMERKLSFFERDLCPSLKAFLCRTLCNRFSTFCYERMKGS